MKLGDGEDTSSRPDSVGVDSSGDASPRERAWADCTRHDQQILLQRAKTEKLKSKTVYYCARSQKLKPARKPMKNRGPVRSKKDVCCQYAAWMVVFESEPDSKYYVELKGHTGHDPWENAEEVRWLRNDPFVEQNVENLIGFLSPSQILDKLQEGVCTTGYSNPYSRLTIEKIETIRKRWMRKNRIESDDKRSVALMLDSKEFPEPLFRIDTSVLGEQKFHLGICSDFQAAMLKKFGDVVYLDTVHGMTKYGYLQLTMLVMDEFGHGCPVAFSMLGPTETCEDWVLLIDSAFRKAGRASENTTFMIDNSSVMKAAVNQVVLRGTGSYILCAFHMMQDINRRLCRHVQYNSGKKYHIEKHIILGKIKALRLLTNADTFRVESQKFKEFILRCQNMRDKRDFIKYYEKVWEMHAEEWANFGRMCVSHYRQNTNNLIESFFCRLRYRFCRGKRLKRLDDHLRILVYTVIPKYIRERTNRLLGIESGRHGTTDRKIEHSVLSLVEGNTMRMMQPVLGYGEINVEGIYHYFCLADLTCTCSNPQFGDVCIHIEAAYKTFGYSYEQMLKARCFISDNESDFVSEKPQVVEDLVPFRQDNEYILEFKPVPLFFGDQKSIRMTSILSNIERNHCTCSMFARMGRCCHLPATDEEEKGVIPEHVYMVRRLDCSATEEETREEDPCYLYAKECSRTYKVSDRVEPLEPRCLSFFAKGAARCRHIPPDVDEEVCHRMQEIFNWLDKTYPNTFAKTYSSSDLMNEISSNFSRKSSDRIQKPLYGTRKRRNQ